MKQAKLEAARKIATAAAAVATVLLLAACQTSSPQNTDIPRSGVNSEGPAYNSGGALNSLSPANSMGGTANSLGPVNRVEPAGTRAKANKL